MLYSDIISLSNYKYEHTTIVALLELGIIWPADPRPPNKGLHSIISTDPVGSAYIKVVNDMNIYFFNLINTTWEKNILLSDLGSSKVVNKEISSNLLLVVPNNYYFWAYYLNTIKLYNIDGIFRSNLSSTNLLYLTDEYFSMFYKLVPLFLNCFLTSEWLEFPYIYYKVFKTEDSVLVESCIEDKLFLNLKAEYYPSKLVNLWALKETYFIYESIYTSIYALYLEELYTSYRVIDLDRVKGQMLLYSSFILNLILVYYTLLSTSLNLSRGYLNGYLKVRNQIKSRLCELIVVSSIKNIHFYWTLYYLSYLALIKVEGGLKRESLFLFVDQDTIFTGLTSILHIA